MSTALNGRSAIYRSFFFELTIYVLVSYFLSCLFCALFDKKTSIVFGTPSSGRLSKLMIFVNISFSNEYDRLKMIDKCVG